MHEDTDSSGGAASHDGEDDAGSLRELLRVALPLMISSGSISLTHVVDRVMLSRLSVEALAASMPAGVIYWTCFSLPFGMAIYTNTFVAQYTGAGRLDRVVASIWQGLYVASLFGIVLAGLSPFAPSLLSWTGHAPAVLAKETVYFSVLTWGALPALWSMVLSSYFSGRGRTLVVMWVHVALSLVNVVLDYLLIFGWGPIPQLGIRGAALATNTANWVGCTSFAWLAFTAIRSEGGRVWDLRRPDWGLIRRQIRFGLPAGVQHFVDVGSFAMFIAFVGRLGTDKLAATTIAFNLNSMAFIPIFGLGTAIMTLVGRRVGERRIDRAEQTTRRGFFVAALYMLAFIVLYLSAPALLLAPFGVESAETRAQVVTLLKFVSLYSFFDATAIVYGSAVRGAGDTRFSLTFTAISGILVMVIPAYIATSLEQHALTVCWSAVTCYIAVLGVGFVLRFRAGHWQSMSVIERSDESAKEPALVGAGKDAL